jgi:hypothetical protein
VILECRSWEDAELINENHQRNNPNEKRNAMRIPLGISESYEQRREKAEEKQV